MQQSDSVLLYIHIFTYTHIYIPFHITHHMVYHRIWNILMVPVQYSRALLFVFMYIFNTVHWEVLNFLGYKFRCCISLDWSVRYCSEASIIPIIQTENWAKEAEILPGSIWRGTAELGSDWSRLALESELLSTLQLGGLLGYPALRWPRKATLFPLNLDWLPIGNRMTLCNFWASLRQKLGQGLSCNLLGTAHWHQAEGLWPPSLCPLFSLHPAHTIPCDRTAFSHSSHSVHATPSSTVPSLATSPLGAHGCPILKGTQHLLKTNNHCTPIHLRK